MAELPENLNTEKINSEKINSEKINSEKINSIKLNERDSVALEITRAEGANVWVKYHTLNQNSPVDNSNYIGLWRSDSRGIPQGKKAVWSEKVDKSETTSNYKLQKLPIDDKAYVLGYCQTSKDPKEDLETAQNVSAIALIPEVTGASGSLLSMTLEVYGNSTDEAGFKYELLANVDCQKHWFGIWNLSEKQIIGKHAPKYSQKVAEADRDRTGIIDVSECSFIRDDMYILAYFSCGFNPSATAAVLSDTCNMVSYVEFCFPSK